MWPGNRTVSPDSATVITSRAEPLYRRSNSSAGMASRTVSACAPLITPNSLSRSTAATARNTDCCHSLYLTRDASSRHQKIRLKTEIGHRNNANWTIYFTAASEFFTSCVVSGSAGRLFRKIAGNSSINRERTVKRVTCVARVGVEWLYAQLKKNN